MERCERRSTIRNVPHTLTRPTTAEKVCVTRFNTRLCLLSNNQPGDNSMATRAKQSRRPRKESPDATELLVLELQAIHNAESQLSRVIPRLSKATDSEQLGGLM